jgi:chromosome segregation ATPase
MSSFFIFPNTRVVSLLRERETELEKLLQQMDTSQEEFDRISVAVADRQSELASKQRELARIAKLRKAHELEPVPACVDSRSCPDSAFNPEHLAWLRDRRSIIAELHHTVNQVESDTQLENEVDALRQQIATLHSQSTRLQRKIQRVISNHHKFDEECHFCRARRKETGNQIRTYRKAAKDAETVRAGLLTRKVAIEAASNPASGLPSIVANLEKELDVYGNNIEKLDEEIGQYQIQAGVTKPALSAREQERAADWMMGMDEDLVAIEAAVRTRKADLDKSLKEISKLEKRYSTFCSLPVMRKKKGLKGDIDLTDVEIDDLLRRVPKEEPSPGVRTRSDIEQTSRANTEFETEVMNFQRELNRKMQAFAVEEARMKKQIRKQRDQCTITEKLIQNQILDMKLKIVQKDFK